MSEYQYYEFLAIDQPVSDADQRWLRGLSTRADITSTRFVNEYHWGDFKGDPVKLMRRCFDAHVYISNFGYCCFMVKVPANLVDGATMQQYASEVGIAVKSGSDAVLVVFNWNDDAGSWELTEEPSGWMVSLAPLREDLIAGDYRALYLAWLLNVQQQMLDDDVLEPTVPPGLGSLSAPCEALLDFLQIDRRLVDVAGEASPSLPKPKSIAPMLREWVKDLAAKERDDLLVRFLLGDEPRLRRETIRTLQKKTSSKQEKSHQAQRRTVGQLFSEWDRRVREGERRKAEKAARERARREKEEARKRRVYIDDLAKRLTGAWKKVESLILERTPQSYERAVSLLRDLRDASALVNKDADFRARLQDTLGRHARKSTLIERVKQAGL